MEKTWEPLKSNAVPDIGGPGIANSLILHCILYFCKLDTNCTNIVFYFNINKK
jgi:hypothetical protein